ncbi:hypothetical protein ACQPW1_32020 [Nocardia sp. CA-128927]
MSQTSPEERSGSTFAWSEDWLAAIVGLALIALVLVGVIPDWLVP